MSMIRISPRHVISAVVMCIAAWPAALSAIASADDNLPECTIAFSSPCPDQEAVCGAFFDGGEGCLFENLPNCYTSGLQAFKVTPDAPLTIEFEGDVVSLELFFAHTTGASGTMTFLNADGNEVGTPLMTNGDCLTSQPDAQEVEFPEAITTIEVTAEDGDVWIDTFVVNPFIPGPPGDLTGNGKVTGEDLGILLSQWGPCDDCDDCPADLVGNCEVGGADLGILLSNWTG